MGLYNAKAAFGIVADGSDETTKINAALAAAGEADTGDCIVFPPGIYGCDGLDQLTSARSFVCSGMERTTFKNLSPDVRLFEIEPSPAPGVWGGDFTRLSGFSIDQNGCSAPAIALSRQYNGLKDVWVRNQGGGENGQAAIKARNATLADLDNVHVSNSDNCLDLEDCYYLTGKNVSLERQRGYAIKALRCPSLDITHLYLDNGNNGPDGPYHGSAGYSVGPMLEMKDCGTVNLPGLAMEMHTGGALRGVDGGPSGNAYMRWVDCQNVNVSAARVNHSMPVPSSYLFDADGGELKADGVLWYENNDAMILFGSTGRTKALTAKNVVTKNTAVGSSIGIGMWRGKAKRVIVKNWTDENKACALYLHAGDIGAYHVDPPVCIEADSGRRTLMNCFGGVTGHVSGAHMVNC